MEEEKMMIPRLLVFDKISQEIPRVLALTISFSQLFSPHFIQNVQLQNMDGKRVSNCSSMINKIQQFCEVSCLVLQNFVMERRNNSTKKKKHTRAAHTQRAATSP